MTTMNHEYYVSLEVAKLLKDAGFDWECKTYYDTSIYFDETIIEDELRDYNFMNGNIRFSAPAIDVAQRWLREVKGVEVYAHVFYDTYDTSEGWDVYVYEVNHIVKQIEDWINSYDVYHSYEEAQESGIKKALEIILEKGE